MNKELLKEAQQNIGEEPVIYWDDATGDYYYFDGDKFVKIGNKPLTLGDDSPLDQEAFDKEAEERAKTLERERQEIQDKLDKGEELDDFEKALLEPEESDEERQNRVDSLAKLFSDEDAIEKAIAEVTKKSKYHERKAEFDRDIRQGEKRKQRQASGEYDDETIPELIPFEMSLQYFIKKGMRKSRQSSWSKPNMSYEGSGIIRKGRRTEKSQNIPKISVYFDQSGSWGENAIKQGMAAIKILDNYEQRGKIEINVFYFANRIDTKSKHQGGILGGAGTGAGPEILEHIRSTKPDNVIIMTDADIALKGHAYYPNYWTGRDRTERFADPIPCTPVTVPGARWCIWRNESNADVESFIRGAQLNEEFMI